MIIANMNSETSTITADLILLESIVFLDRHVN